jgi:hypothetical protein
MQKNIVKKGLVITVIFLFIAVSFQPAIAVEPSEKLTDNDEKIEYTIQIIKTNKVIEKKVYLTQQQADELENLIENIRADLFNSETQEETNEIYNNAVNSFNNLGLFPEDITLNEIKQLVIGETQKLYSIKFKNEMSNGFENSLCFVSGDSWTTYFLRPGLFVLLKMIGLFSTLLPYISSSFELKNANESSLGYFWFYLLFFPFRIGDIVYLGETMWYWFGDPEPIDYIPAVGWISTVGTNGIKNHKGSFFGNLLEKKSPRDSMWVYYPGIFGFTGIRINKSPNSAFYMGFALKVSIRY